MDAASPTPFREPSPPDPSTFKLDPSGAADRMMALSGSVTLSPRVLVALLGAPYVADGTKSSGQYVFTGKHPFLVYEMESTRNSGEGCGPMPAVFWMTDRPYEFHIGAPLDLPKPETVLFSLWLRARVSSMLHAQHATNLAALERLLSQLHDKALTPAKATDAARALAASWKLGPVAAPKVTQPRTTGQRKLDRFEDWNAGGGKDCDPFVKPDLEGPPPAVSFGHEDPRSIWQEVLRGLVEEQLTTDYVAALRTLLAAKPGEEWNAWETYAPRN